MADTTDDTTGNFENEIATSAHPFFALLRAGRASQSVSVAQESEPAPWAAYADAIPTVEDADQYTPTEIDQLVTDAVHSVSIYEMYRALLPGNKIQPPNKTDSNMAQCPDPAHPDTHQSASYNRDTNLLVCHRDEVGWDPIKLACLVLGVDQYSSDFRPMMHQLARQLRGVDYDYEMSKVALQQQAPQVNHSSPVPQFQAPPVTASSLPPMQPQVVITREDLEEARVEEMRVSERRRRQVRRDVDAEEQESEFSPPEIHLNVRAARPHLQRKKEWLVDGLHMKMQTPRKTLIIAGKKAGKSTVMVNLMRCLADGGDLFGEHEVKPVDGTVFYQNYELDEEYFVDQVDAMGVQNDDRLIDYNLRKLPRAQHMNLLNPAWMEWTLDFFLANQVKVWIIDPLADALPPGANPDKAEVVIPFFKNIDAIMQETGCEVFIPAHSPKSREQQMEARGSSAIDAWPDHLWFVLRDEKNYLGQRSFMAEGRGIVQEKTKLKIDDNGILSYDYSGVKIPTGSAQSVEVKTLAALAGTSGISRKALYELVKGNVAAFNACLDDLKSRGEVVQQGAGARTKLYLAADAPSQPGLGF